MAKQIINQKSSDNTYFHKDFHIALNYGIAYLHQRFGEGSVKEYLIQFVVNYHAPLKKAIKEKGLFAIKEHYEKIFKIENAEFDMKISNDDLVIHLYESPAVMYIKAEGHRVSALYQETVITVNKEICRNTPYDCEMLEYKHENGAFRLRFFKREI